MKKSVTFALIFGLIGCLFVYIAENKLGMNSETSQIIMLVIFAVLGVGLGIFSSGGKKS